MAARAPGLVSSCAISAGGSGRPVAAEGVEGLVDCHVGSQKHRLEAFEESAAGEVATVEDDTHVGPLCVHRAGGVDWCDHLDLAASGIVPNDLDEVIRIDGHIGVALVTDDRGEQRLANSHNGFSRLQVRLDH